MTRETITATVDRALLGRELLTHPFYVRWSRGELGIDELRAYAAQYRHVEAALPEVLATITAGSADDAVREPVLRNLADEAGGEVTHLELFDRFARALEAPAAPVSPATLELIAAQRELAAASPAEGLAALLAYERQSPLVSASKAEGLRRHHGLDGAALEFWDVHSGIDATHADWTLDALVASGGDPSLIGAAAERAATAWWAFLDEREAAAPQR